MITHTHLAPAAANAKTAFGQFVSAKRRGAGLTQRDLARRLFVTESAVSKWERGLSYPDISLVTALSSILGITEGELINASEDRGSRIVEGEARVYRRSRAAILWFTGIATATAVVASFVVNLAVQHTLSWFFVVVFAAATVFSVTTLPLLVRRSRGWITLGALLGSLFALLATTQLLYGGDYFVVTSVSLVFASVLLFSPFAIRALASEGARHRLVAVLVVDSVALVVFLFAVLGVAGRLDAFVSPALPVACFCLALVWVVALVIRYLPVGTVHRAAIVIALSGLFTLATNPVVEAIVDGGGLRPQPADLSVWRVENISGNVALLIALGCLLVAVGLVAYGRLARRRAAARF